MNLGILKNNNYDIYKKFIIIGAIRYINYDECEKIHDMLTKIFQFRYHEDSLSSINEYINNHFENNINVRYDIYSFHLYISDIRFIVSCFQNTDCTKKEIIYDNLFKLSLQILKLSFERNMT